MSALIGVTLVSAAGQTAVAQSLADAARRAQEQRQEHPDSQTFTDGDLGKTAATRNTEAVRFELTMPVLQQYNAVRTAVLRKMVASVDLAKQVLGATGRAGPQGVAGLEREYADIPEVVDAIRAGQMTVHSYVITEVAFMAAVGVLAGKLSVSGAPAGAIGMNIEFLKRHEQEIAGLWKEALTLEEQLTRQFATQTSAPPPSDH
jgi:hypothetical protein